MNTTDTQQNNLQQRTKQANKQIFIWTMAWLITLAMVAFGPKFLWDFNTTVSLIAIVLNILAGYKMIIANKDNLMSMDELQRMIQLNGMAVSLGVSMVFGALYGLLESIRLIEHSPNPANILFVMSISYGISIWVGNRRYM